jgi:hypothetical protein
MKKDYKKAFEAITRDLNKEEADIEAMWEKVCDSCPVQYMGCTLYSQKCLNRLRKFYLK